MPTKTPVTVSVVLTVILLLLLTAFMMLMQIVLMNGVMSSRQTNLALGTSLGCQGVDVLLGALLSGRLTRSFLTRFNMNKALAVVLAVLPIGVAAAVMSTIAIFVSFAVAGIK